MSNSFFELSAKDNRGKLLDFSGLEGKVVLAVNTASKCGFTPQYKGLQGLHERFSDKGLVVLGFPCDQFAHQEPGDAQAIEQFCHVNYGVSFQLMEKIEVNGPGTHPVFNYLKDRAPGLIGKNVKWNFTKFLVARDGKRVTRYAPNVEPESIAADIEKALGA
jgi:glutathione peroxidase